MRGQLVVTTFTYKKNSWTHGVDASIMPYNVLNKIILNSEEKKYERCRRRTSNQDVKT